jgi:alkylmercury lyase
MTHAHVEEFARLLAANPAFESRDMEVIAAVYDALADGEPVTIDQLTGKVGRSTEDVTEAVGRANVHFDDERIVAFGGLSLAETAHVFEVRGNRLYTWCAWDPLFIAPILGEDARVQTSCPVTGQAITLVVGPSGVREVSPPTAVLSLRVPDESCRADVVTNFCSMVHLFASRAAADDWLRERAAMFIVDLQEAFELGRALVEQRGSRPAP